MPPWSVDIALPVAYIDRPLDHILDVIEWVIRLGDSYRAEYMEYADGTIRYAVETTWGDKHPVTVIRVTPRETSITLAVDDMPSDTGDYNHLIPFLLQHLETRLWTTINVDAPLMPEELPAPGTPAPAVPAAQQATPAESTGKLSPDKVIETFYRRKARNSKITLKQVCAEMGVNYDSIRVAKVAYDKRRRRRHKD